MSLAADIAAFKPKGCETCRWFRTQPEESQAAFTQWVTDFRKDPRSYPLADLRELCIKNGLDGAEAPPRTFREHCNTHMS